MVSLDTINILTGICLVMLGRRLYWLFVGLLGFLYALLTVSYTHLTLPTIYSV